MMFLPFVSIIMPLRNEAKYIERGLASVLAQDYPADRFEVLVVDGMSDDGTRDILQRMVARLIADDSAPAVLLLDNPARIVPPALNIALQHASGEIVIRVDGHCEIAPDYVRRCVSALDKTGADCVGGPMVTIGETPAAKAIALAQSSRFGVGGVAFRTGKEQAGYVDTLAFGAYRRSVFNLIGGFDEELVRNQDDEFNFRLTQAGGKIWLDPAIRSAYYSRASLPGLWRQYYQYGMYKVRVMQKRRGVASWRHLVPGAFVVGLLVSFLVALAARQPRYALAAAVPYAGANGIASVWTGRSSWRSLPLLPVAFLILHLSYGLGFLMGLWRWRAQWPAAASN
jgi:succinoglycan biosynthesis protein ExoA